MVLFLVQVKNASVGRTQNV